MKHKLFLFILFSLLFVCSINTSAQEERFVLPVDEAAEDSSFKTFRDSLLKAVKTKNKAQLIAALDKNIKVSFGAEEGVEDFKKFWKINSPTSEVWNVLLSVLENGGSFVEKGANKTFCAPYLFTKFPDDLDAFQNQAIFGTNVNLREKPNLSSKVVTKLSYNVVTVDFENSVTSTTDAYQYIWAKVNTLGGKTGYVGAKFVRSPIDYRACFQKVSGRWKMTAFVAGD